MRAARRLRPNMAPRSRCGVCSNISLGRLVASPPSTASLFAPVATMRSASAGRGDVASDTGHRSWQFVPIETEVVGDLAHEPRIKRLLRADVGKNSFPVSPVNGHIGMSMGFDSVLAGFEAAAVLGQPFAKVALSTIASVEWFYRAPKVGHRHDLHQSGGRDRAKADEAKPTRRRRVRRNAPR